MLSNCSYTLVSGRNYDLFLYELHGGIESQKVCHKHFCAEFHNFVAQADSLSLDIERRRMAE